MNTPKDLCGNKKQYRKDGGKRLPFCPPSSPPQHFSAGDHSIHLKLFLAQEAQPERDLTGSHQLLSMKMLSSLAARASKSQKKVVLLEGQQTVYQGVNEEQNMARPYSRVSHKKGILTHVTTWMSTKDLKGAGHKGQLLCPCIESPQCDENRDREESTDCVLAGFLLLCDPNT